MMKLKLMLGMAAIAGTPGVTHAFFVDSVFNVPPYRGIF